MLINHLNILRVKPGYIIPCGILANHSQTCPSRTKVPLHIGSGKGTSSGKGAGSSIKTLDFKRAEKSGKCRMGFIPEEWFLFFHTKTGVSGPYVFGVVLINYLVSKEIFVMEHEYYLGLSITLVLYLVTTRLGPGIGASLDKNVDDELATWEKGRKNEMDGYQAVVKAAKDSQWRAEGQKELMDAKKENIAMQLEAEYRERYMRVYKTVKGRMDYHVKKSRAETRVQQKWMITWILENVKKAITPEFQKQALNSAIRELAAAASHAK